MIGYAFRELKKKLKDNWKSFVRCISPPGGSVQAASSRFVSLRKNPIDRRRALCLCLLGYKPAADERLVREQKECS